MNKILTVLMTFELSEEEFSKKEFQRFIEDVKSGKLEREFMNSPDIEFESVSINIQSVTTQFKKENNEPTI